MNNTLIKPLFVSIAFWFPAVSVASLEGELGLEWRGFFEPGLYGQDMSQSSIRGELSYDTELFGGEFESVVFGRVDHEDSRRTHADLRELSWTYVGDEWSLKAGVSKVFWGVTESAHLVDIINQTDGVESVDGEDKLGQPMLKLSSEKEWGTVDLFWLPYFRERTLPGLEGRLALPLDIQYDNTFYESGAEEWHSDVAIRYSHYIDDLDFALSHFTGTSRAPELLFNNSLSAPALIPFYEQIDQTGLELQYIIGSWLLKFEGISNKGMSDRYSAAVAGFEYTQVGIFDSFADLGWLMEYHHDDRKNDTRAAFENDVFVGWRYAFNDADSSEILVGGIFDTQTNEKVYSLEMSQRLAGDLKVFIEAWVFDGLENQGSSLPEILASDPDQKTRYLQTEDYVQLELVKYF